MNQTKVTSTLNELFSFNYSITNTSIISTDVGEILEVTVEHPTHPNILHITVSLPYEEYIP